MGDRTRVTVWNEFRHEQSDEAVAAVYPDGIHGAIAAYLESTGEFDTRTATLDEPDHGLGGDVLDTTDVLVWWGHIAHGEAFRSGCCFYRGKGRVFYFRPGHESYPVYHHQGVLKILANACHWARPVPCADHFFGNAKPLEGIPQT